MAKITVKFRDTNKPDRLFAAYENGIKMDWKLTYEGQVAIIEDVYSRQTIIPIDLIDEIYHDKEMMRYYSLT